MLEQNAPLTAPTLAATGFCACRRPVAPVAVCSLPLLPGSCHSSGRARLGCLLMITVIIIARICLLLVITESMDPETTLHAAVVSLAAVPSCAADVARLLPRGIRCMLGLKCTKQEITCSLDLVEIFTHVRTTALFVRVVFHQKMPVAFLDTFSCHSLGRANVQH